MIWVVYGQTFRATPQKLVDIAEPRIVNRNALYRKPPLFLWDKLVLVQFWGVLNSVPWVYQCEAIMKNKIEILIQLILPIFYPL